MIAADKPRTSRTPLQPAIQALRAVAVLGVVIYHLWPTALPGGYAGVDVFFVISGFLIIGGLLRESISTGRIALGRFWARRVRRLVPASLLVLVVTAVVTLILVPQIVWQQWFLEIGASALYVQNWALAASSVDYLGAESAASPVQHYWSLSVEEQFYIAWPVLIAVVLLLAGGAAAVKRLRAVMAVLGVLLVVTVASFVLSVIGVAVDDPAAYFATQSRAWEFGLGGLLAFAGVATGRERVRAAASWTGLALILGSYLLFTSSTAFPGFAALVPTIGTALVLWAGVPAVAWSPSRVLAARPVQWIGGVSYSWYLWHWPPIVIGAFLIGAELRFESKVGILVGTLVLAWLTKILLEDPVRSSARLVRVPSFATIGAAVTAGAMVIALSAVVTVRVEQDLAAAEQLAKEALADVGLAPVPTPTGSASSAPEPPPPPPHSCVGAPAALPDGICPDPYAPTELTNASLAKRDVGRGVDVSDPCKQQLQASAVITCEIGDIASGTTTIALVGDSHAGHLIEGLDAWGRDNRVRFVTYLKTWCAGTGQPGIAAAHVGSGGAVRSCATWGVGVVDSILADSRIEAVMYANYTRPYTLPDPTHAGRTISADDFAAGWTRLIEGDRTVIAVRDVPTMRPMQVPQCIAGQPGVVDPCTRPRAEVLPAEDVDPLVVAATANPDVELIDLTPIFCDEATCHTLIGGVIAYFDAHHLTSTFSLSLAPILGDAIDDALGRTHDPQRVEPRGLTGRS